MPVSTLSSQASHASELVSSSPCKKTARIARLRVIISGGSIAGLALAHALHHSDIDFVVLEARREIAPQVGASIVVLPNGARILDQLGLYDDVRATTEPISRGLTWTADGKCIMNTNGPVLTGMRMGYPLMSPTRRDVLKVLYEHIPDKSKVQTLKRVSKVDHSDSGVVVHCEDGSQYEGDIVVGADGIHSTVKSLMLQHIERSNPGTTEKDRNSISAGYNCIFGIGNPVKGQVTIGDSHRSYAKDHSTWSFVGRGGMLYWFLFSKLEKTYSGKEIPVYSKGDMEEAVKAFYDIHMTSDIKFKEVWEQRTFANMCSLEEAINDHWTSDRFVCLGDSIHKMTPNLGAGGNAAIESAAALANSLSKIANPNPSLDQIRTVLTEFHEKRRDRANNLVRMSNKLTQIEALSNTPNMLLGLYGIPALRDILSDLACDSIVGAELLDSLPPPARSLKATMPWNPETGVGKHEDGWKRALHALPILLALYGASKTMRTTLRLGLPILKTASGTGEIPLDTELVAPLWREFSGIKLVDNIISVYAAVFTPAIGGFDVVSRLQLFAFLADLVPIQAIWMVEGIRRGNFTTAAHLLPTLLGVLYQFFGIGYIAPIYYFLHYIQSPLQNYQAADNRMTQIGQVKTIIPTIILSYIIPSIAMFFTPGLTTRQWINGIFWQPFPVYAAIWQRVLGKCVTDTTGEDRIYNPEADMPYLRAIYGFAGITAACANIYVRFKSPVSLIELFFGGISNPSATVPLMEKLAKFFRYDQIATFGAGAIWTILSFSDLKRAGVVESGWVKIIGSFVGLTVVTGPGAAMAAMWAWREESLATRKTVIPRAK